jgi:hypothetical protein
MVLLQYNIKYMRIIKYLYQKIKSFFRIVYDMKTIRDSILEEHYTNLIHNSKGLNRFEAKFFSQHGEDGIIAEIFKRIGTNNKTFFEFGAGTQFENNSIYLLLNGWSGAWLDGNKKNINFLKRNFKKYIDSNKLKLSDKFISSKNINNIVKELDIPKDLDFLSIDIDGNDYYIWKACELEPRVLCIETNPRFNYDSDYLDEENENFGFPTPFSGSGLKQIVELSEKKGYVLIATDLSGVNAFFVKKEYKDKFEILNIEDLYNKARFYLQFYRFY